MKVLMLNGSPKASGNTALALAEMEKVFGAVSPAGIASRTASVFLTMW